MFKFTLQHILVLVCIISSTVSYRKISKNPLRTPMMAVKSSESYAGNLGETSRTCKQCKQQFNPAHNFKSKTCTFHPGIYSGRLNRINDVDTSDLEFFWSCCGEYQLSSIGCLTTHHYTYDDDSSPAYSRLDGKLNTFVVLDELLGDVLYGGYFENNASYVMGRKYNWLHKNDASFVAKFHHFFGFNSLVVAFFGPECEQGIRLSYGSVQRFPVSVWILLEYPVSVGKLSLPVGV
eukprot:gene7102-14447_t